MTKQDKAPFLYFNFANIDGVIQDWQFISPIKYIIAQTIEEVMPCLEEVQQAVNDGFYVAGYLSYESAPAFHDCLTVHQNHQMPLLWFGVFNEPINKPRTSTHPFSTTKWEPNISVNDYYQHIDQIHQHIHNKETEQVNYTIQFNSKFTGDPFAFYKQLAKAQSANYSAYLNIGEFSILSASPELFFHLHKGIITTRPMKGTVSRGHTTAEDEVLASWLHNSTKNRNENDLIVKLMEKELETIAKPRTVTLKSSYNIEKYPTVFQMTSTIQAELKENKQLLDIFNALFPCGSITGLPKRETMDIITDLEDNPRNIYCGAIGFVTPKQEAIFNVPIRTVLINNKSGLATYGVGGAITSDSTKEEEYAEVLTKSKLLSKKDQPFKLLESFGLKNGHYIVFERHLKRLMDSAIYFNFNIDISNIRRDLNELARKHPSGYWKVRLLVANNGKHLVKIEKVIPITETVPIVIAKKPIDDDLFLYHKTTNRKIYDQHKANNQNIYDVLLWNKEKQVTEFTIGNIVVKLNEKLYTPPISCGLLPGTYRESLLAEGKISEKIITLKELKQCTDIWLINSVREWTRVELVTNQPEI